MTPKAQVLELRVVFLEEGKDDPTLSIRIDGRPIFETIKPTGYQGFDPESMLSADGALSVPSSTIRVAIYQCSCGEPGCGVVSPLVSVEDDLIRWSDFRDFTGVFSEPTLEASQESRYLGSDRGYLLPIDDLVFDRAQFESEVERARLDRSWESPERETARLVREGLHADEQRFAAEGRRVGWVSYPWWKAGPCGWMVETQRRFPDGYIITWDDDVEQAIAEVGTQPASPADQAADILRQLRAVPITRWADAFPSSLG